MKKKVRKGKISIAEATRRIIDTHPFIADCLKMGIVNYTALAEHLKREISEALGLKKINLDSIKMAIVRYSEELRNSLIFLEKKVVSVIAESVLELKNDLTVLTVDQTAFLRNLSKIYANLEKYRFFQLTQGIDTFTLIVDVKSIRNLKKLFNSTEIRVLLGNQSAILLSSPETIIETPGVISFITEVLANNNVNITQIISCHTDTIFILNREDALKAYSLIEKLIIDLRRAGSSKFKP